MRLSVFDIVDNTLSILNDNRSFHKEVSRNLRSYFGLVFNETNSTELVLEIKSRVKSPESLREKIIRRNLYKKYSSPDCILDNLSDLIGIRIECRFIKEEVRVFEVLRSFFNIVDENNYCYNEKCPSIRLELLSPQPQQQKNNLPIYRIDGIYLSEDRQVRFELQIKSLVHSFWAEIEHKILYKNNTYMLIDGFYKELMASVYENLSLLDNQLLIIYNQIEITKEKTYSTDTVKHLIAKTINDMFIVKMHSTLGFTLDFKESCVILSDFMLMKHKQSKDSNNTLIAEVFQRLSDIISRDIDFEKQILFEGVFKGRNKFCDTLGSELKRLINIDFEWNLFFRMLFEIELGNNIEDFGTFLNVLNIRFLEESLYSPLYKSFSPKEIEEIQEDMMQTLANALVEVKDIKIIYESNLKKVCFTIATESIIIADALNTIEEWRENRSNYLNVFYNKILKVFMPH